MECGDQAAGVLAQIEKGNKKKQGIQVRRLYINVVTCSWFSHVIVRLNAHHGCNTVEQGRRGEVQIESS